MIIQAEDLAWSRCLSVRDGVAFGVSGDASLARWRLDQQSGPSVIVATGHERISDLAVHPRLPLVAVAPEDAPVELRGDDFSAGETLDELMDASALAFSPDGRWLAAAMFPERVVLFDLENRRITAEVPAGERNDCVDFSADGTLLATTCSFQGGAHVRVDRVTADGGLVPVAEIDRVARDTIPAAVFTPDSRYLVIWETSAIFQDRNGPGWRGDLLLTDTDGTIVWQRRIDVLETGVSESLSEAGAPMGWFTKPLVTRDMIALGLDGAVLTLRTNDGTPLVTHLLPGNVLGVADAGDGSLVVATDQGFRRLDLRTKAGRALRRLFSR